MIQARQDVLFEHEDIHKLLCKIEEQSIRKHSRFIRNCARETWRLGKDTRLTKSHEGEHGDADRCLS